MSIEGSVICSTERHRGWPWEGSRENQGVLGSAARNVPRITVVTPSYNQCKYLEATILSVLHQNYPNIEYIVLDGGSTDNSIDLITKYEDRIAYWHSEKDQGQADALATGFEMATGEMYCWLNSDDVFLPGALMHAAALFQKHENVDFVYGNRMVIDELGNVTGRHRWPYYLTRHHWYDGQPLAQECCFWRSELYNEAGGIDRDKYFIMDYDLFYRMWRIGEFKKTRRYLGCMRRHDDSKNAKHQAIRQEELGAARRKFGLAAPGYVTARMINRIDRLQVLIEKTLES